MPSLNLPSLRNSEFLALRSQQREMSDKHQVGQAGILDCCRWVPDEGRSHGRTSKIPSFTNTKILGLRQRQEEMQAGLWRRRAQWRDVAQGKLSALGCLWEMSREAV